MCKCANIIMSVKRSSDDQWSQTDTPPPASSVEIRTDFDNVGVQDLALFDVVTSQAVLANLLKRFHSDISYTRIGSGTSSELLIYLNPNKPLAIYNDDFKKAYSSIAHYRALKEHPPPHIYSLVNNILSRGRSGLQRSQSIILTGEAGSGKSINFQEILNYIHYLNYNTPPALQLIKHHSISNVFSTSFQELSSRCMKLVEMEFDFQGNLLASHFFNYHLEKWRVVNCNNNNNFQIFYILLAGSESSFLKSLGLVRNQAAYRILSSEQQNLIKNNNKTSNPQTQLAFIKATLSELLKPTETNDKTLELFQILAGILKLGNLTFVPTTNMDGTEGVELILFQNSHSPMQGESVFGLDIIKSISDCGGDSSLKSNKILKLLLETVYFRLYNWLTRKLTTTTTTNNQTTTSFKVSMLDYGGLNLSRNKACPSTFEEFIFNYINEKVQFSLVDFKLRQFQENYSKEGLEWIIVDTSNSNNDSILLIENQLLHAVNSNNTTAISNNNIFNFHDHQLHPPDTFTIHHYSAKESSSKSYSWTDFQSKNSNELPPSLQSALSNSKNTIIRELFPSKLKTKKLLSSYSQAVISVMNCIKRLETTNLHYIRCIRPNSELNEANMKLIETSYVKYQIMYHRIIDQLKVIKYCYSFEFNYNEFVKRYKLLSLKTWPNPPTQQNHTSSAIAILNDVGLKPNVHFTIGNHYALFIKSNALLELEEYRGERQEDLCILIQKTWRAFKVRKAFLSKKSAQLTISRSWKKHLNKLQNNQVQQIKRFRRATVLIQNYYIQWKRRMYLKELDLNIKSRSLNMVSPVCKEWPFVPSYLQETNCLLKSIFHRWRCREYRRRVESGSERARLNEKATASLIFKNHKLSYPRSISHPFLGDYIRLRQNSQWRRTAMYLTPAPSSSSNQQCNNLIIDNNGTDNNDKKELHQQYQPFNIVFADLINKVTRSSGKFLPIVLVVTTTEILILDPRTLNLKYKINFEDLVGISMSNLNDDICLMHIKESNNSSLNNSTSCGLVNVCSTTPSSTSGTSGTTTAADSSTSCILFENMMTTRLDNTKGDLVLHTCHLIEMVTKIYLVYKNFFSFNSQKLPVLFGNEFPATFGHQSVTISFKTSQPPPPTSSVKESLENKSSSVVVPPNQMRITRKKFSRMEFVLL